MILFLIGLLVGIIAGAVGRGAVLAHGPRDVVVVVKGDIESLTKDEASKLGEALHGMLVKRARKRNPTGGVG